MQKEFTINIPDERWIDSWDNNLTLTKIYTGPSKFYAPVSLETNTLVGVYFETTPTTGPYLDAEKFSLHEIDANVDTAIAQVVLEATNDEYKQNYIHEFEDETLHDGSIYAKPTNPMLSNYYRLRYDTLTLKIVLEAIFSDAWQIPQLGVVNQKLAVLNYNKTSVSFSQTMLTKITTAITQLEAYKATIVNARNWKYDTFDMDEIPAISKSVEQALKPVPVQEPTQPDSVPEASNE
jgi:hypothetical protein